ncbi:hypothetical protein AYO20_01653 [Fonsecaea nubica]|uniref:Uncharacterized protein n=1 Tax=Fonsecaea nubica TaxID=856822 RepID=A0A178DBA7_9EURO|nr:hypothetical protein AYO20_01653 [Fonsecaea nubica]OAL38902.1 hypothetical protein AYO20_01653 [Fonsecaea nubica]
MAAQWGQLRQPTATILEPGKALEAGSVEAACTGTGATAAADDVSAGDIDPSDPSSPVVATGAETVPDIVGAGIGPRGGLCGGPDTARARARRRGLTRGSANGTEPTFSSTATTDAWAPGSGSGTDIESESGCETDMRI